MLDRTVPPRRPQKPPPIPEESEREASAEELRLARELEKLLAIKKSDASEKRGQPQAAVRSVEDLEAFEKSSDDFEWAEPDDNDQWIDQAIAAGAADDWVRKAKRDRLRRKIANVFGWVTTIVIGAMIIAGSAYLATGMTLEFNSVTAALQRLLS